MSDDYRDICHLAAAMEPDARAVLAAVARRLAKGREQYGDLVIDNDPRDWLKEAAEESFDMSAYLAVQLIKMMRVAQMMAGRVVPEALLSPDLVARSNERIARVLSGEARLMDEAEFDAARVAQRKGE